MINELLSFPSFSIQEAQRLIAIVKKECKKTVFIMRERTDCMGWSDPGPRK